MKIAPENSARLLAVLILLGTLACGSLLAMGAESRKVFASSIVSIPKVPGLVAAAAPSEDAKRSKILELHFWLQTRNSDELKARVAKGETISPSELQEKYSGSAQQSTALTQWLKSEGFRITRVTPDFTGVYATASVAQIEISLHVHMINVVLHGTTYIAARDAPSLPANVSANVTGIDGLQTFSRANRHSVWSVKSSASATVAAVSTQFHDAAPYVPKEILKAYNGDALGLTGAGQTIAILIDTLPNPSDVGAFWKRTGIAGQADHIVPINVSGGALPAQEGEESLDVEWASGIAPGAKIRVYAAGSLAFVDLDKALDQILADLVSDPSLRQLSVSLGLGETYMSADEVAQEDARFVRMAAVGLNVFVSTGDAGSNPDETGHDATGPLQVEYQSSDPFVVAVGGTTLESNGAASPLAESAWVGSGGGMSRLFPRPVWQKGVALAGAKRMTPDVSSAADPDFGALVVLGGNERQIGGTSWSAPTWAGLCALLNEARVRAGKKQLPFLNPLIYPLMGSSAFRDIANGSNGHYSAGAGFDLVTGIGVPNMQELTRVLTQ
jgi:kumamolisin